MKKILQIVIVSLISLILVSCSSDISQVSVTPALQPGAPVAGNPGDTPARKADQNLRNTASQDSSEKPDRNIQKSNGSPEKISNNNNEEKVIISINNFGRTNPFRPFEEKSLAADNPYLPQLRNIPPPPMLSPITSLSVKNLMEIKVSGILYDPNGSSAIITVADKDYLVHKGDMLFNYYIKDITSDKVAVKTGNNIYRAGIGEILGEGVNIDPVRGINKMFGGSKKVGTLPEVQLISPTYVSSTN